MAICRKPVFSPVWKSCTFLGINYYEEISSKFEEYLSEALIPENSCLLNDVCYPLQYVDEFYKFPWKKVKYDEKFFTQEAGKLEESILILTENITLPIHVAEESFVVENFKNSVNIFDTFKFEELKTEDLRKNLFVSNEDVHYLEVPYIPSNLNSKSKPSTFNDLIESLPFIKMEDYFEEDQLFNPENIDIAFEIVSLENENLDSFFHPVSDFNEIDLPELLGHDSDFYNLPVCTEENFFLSPEEKKNTKSDMNNIKLQTNEDLKNEELSNIKNKIDIVTSEPIIKSHTVKQVSEIDNLDNVIPSNFLQFNMSNIEISDTQMLIKDKNSQLYSQAARCEVEKDLAQLSDDIANTIDENYMDDSSLKNFFNDNVFDEDSMDKNLSDNKIKKTNIFKISGKKEESKVLEQSQNTQSFLEKLSKLNYSENCIISDSNFVKSTSDGKDYLNNINWSTVNRNNSSIIVIHSKPSRINKPANKNSFKSEKTQALNVLSSFLSLKKKENEKWSNSFRIFNSYNSVSSDENYFKKSENSNEFSCQDKLQEITSVMLPLEDIVVKLPDDYQNLVLKYEDSSLWFMQKLLQWKKFQLPLNLTIMDISLDSMHFLLNNEIKYCRDQNINPLNGGVENSFYIQLLMFQVILESLNAFIHYDILLALYTFQELEKKHSFLMGYYDDLIQNIQTFIERKFNNDFIHPKIEELCKRLQEIYYFCRDNILPFKVLIILRKHITSFNRMFVKFMKTLLPEITISLIPESCVLQKDTEYFRLDGDQINIVCVTSLSKEVPLENISLVIEYEMDSNLCWKNICSQQNVAHLCVKLMPIPLKTLKDIKDSLIFKDEIPVQCESKPAVIIVSDFIYINYNVKSILDNIPNIGFFKRSYKKDLPHLSFADIAVNYKTCMLIVSLISFLNNSYAETLINEISNLSSKYEVCWVIIQDNLKDVKLDSLSLNIIKDNYHMFLSIILNVMIGKIFKIKILYASTDSEVIKLINCMISKSLKCTTKDFFFSNSSFVKMTEEELFLMSIPSVNPIVASFILSSKISLFNLMNLKAEELYGIFEYVPRRFLEDLHSFFQKYLNIDETEFQSTKENNFSMLLQNYNDGISNQNNKRRKIDMLEKIVNDGETFSEDTNKNVFDKLQKFVDSGGYCKNDYFNTKAVDHTETSFYLTSKHGETEITENFNLQSDLVDEFSPDHYSSSSNILLPKKYSEMSIEDIEQNYQALLLKDLEYSLDKNNSENTCISNMNSSNSSSSQEQSLYQFTLPSPKIRKLDDGLISQQIDFIQHEVEPKNLNNFKNLSASQIHFNSQKSEDYFVSHKLLSEHNPSSNESNHDEKSNINPEKCIKPQVKIKPLNLSSFKYSHKKRSPINNSSYSKSASSFQQNFSVLNKSFKIHKGQSSKTVCKKIKDEIKSPKEVFSQYKSNCSQKHPYPHDYEFDAASCISPNDPDWISQSISLTPRLKNKLSYEKIPGEKGQTRLVFY